MNGKALIASYTYAHLPKASAHPLSSALDVFVNVVSSVSEGGVGGSDAFAGRESIPSPCPPTSVRYVLNVSDVNFSDSRAEMREVSLDEEKSVDDIAISTGDTWLEEGMAACTAGTKHEQGKDSGHSPSGISVTAHPPPPAPVNFVARLYASAPVMRRTASKDGCETWS